MEWYESLFLQACGHVMTHAKIAPRRATRATLNLNVTSTHELVESYQRNVGLAFDTQQLQQCFANGADCALLIQVTEHRFTSALQDIKRLHDVVLSASLATNLRSSDFDTYHIDVAIIRATASGAPGIAH